MIKWYILSVLDDYKGIFCGHCKGLNLFYDDIGWFWFRLRKTGSYHYGCQKCYNRAYKNGTVSPGDR